MSMPLNRESKRERPLGRRAGAVVCVVILGLFVSLIICKQLRTVGHQQLEARFTRIAERHVQAIVRTMADRVMVAEALRSLYEASHEVEPEEFKTAATPYLERYRDIHALQWVPRVSGGTPATHTSNTATTGDRPGHYATQEHYPIMYVWPEDTNEHDLGVDLALDPVRMASINVAGHSGHIAMSSPLTVDTAEGPRRCIVVVVPVYAKDAITDDAQSRWASLDGVLLVVLKTSDLIDAALVPFDPLGLNVCVADTTTPDRAVPIETRRVPVARATAEPSSADQRLLESDLDLDATIAVGDRRWTITCTAGPEFGGHPLANAAGWVLLIGILLTGAAAAWVIAITRHTFRAEALAKGRTAELRRSEAALRESEGMFRAITEVSTDGTIIFDEHMVMRYASPAVGHILGHPLEEIQDRVPGKFIHPDDIPLVRDTLDRALRNRGETYSISAFRVRHRDGRWLTLEALVTGLSELSGVQGAVASFRDITVRAQAEHQLAENMSRLERFNRASVGREQRVLALKQEVNELLERIGEAPRYGSTNRGAKAIAGAPGANGNVATGSAMSGDLG